MVNSRFKYIFMVATLTNFALFAFSADRSMIEPIPKGMVKISAGTYVPFLTDKGVKTNRVASFYLDRYAVTNAEFLSFVRANPKWSKSHVSKLFADATYLKHWKGDHKFSDAVKNSPVTNVSWYAANAYSKWKGKRLPTLNEWEYAGNSASANVKKSIEKIILEWYSKPSPLHLPPVGSSFINKFHVSDLHGLIWEWVSDFNSIMINNDSRSSSTINRDLFCASGSAAAIDKENYAAFMRFAFRSSLQAKYTVNNLGFRCASDIK